MLPDGKPSPADRLAALDASIARGIADSEAGRVLDVDDVAVRLGEKYGPPLED
jgi:predicted transcriptional regulator